MRPRRAPSVQAEPRIHRVTGALAAFLLAGCAAGSGEASARSEIEAAIARGVEATRIQDIDAYMACIPEDAVQRDGAGQIISRDQLRADVLRDWSVIPRTLAIRVTIDSIDVHGDSAIVETSQRWERLMLERDGTTTDTVLTTQRHREMWRRTARGWFAYEIEELGGEVYVNGQLYPQESRP